ncbi:Arylesterase precursor [hydrothermal vent metagenome]|uniref:Arylesterase n=1 Tax=hydrothermal vent metagenome TaxID=652676 RepID=A0A3B1CUK6_9ZZZZ
MKNPTPCFSFLSFARLSAVGMGCAVFFFLAIIPELKGESPPVILAFGDSLTAGFGVADKENYPSRLQAILQQKGYPHRVVNAGVSGDTTAGGVRRISWLMKQKPEIVILALGANDGLRGLSIQEMHSNLKKIIEVCREHQAKVLLAGMKIPPNFGEEYSEEFVEVFVKLAQEFELHLLPFLLEGVAAKREYTQADGIHPLGSGYEIVAANVWEYLEPMLKRPGSAN